VLWAALLGRKVKSLSSGNLSENVFPCFVKKAPFHFKMKRNFFNFYAGIGVSVGLA
jgi:hypothetical protein